MKRGHFDRFCAMLWRYILNIALILGGLSFGGNTVIGLAVMTAGWCMLAHYITKSLAQEEAIEEASIIIAKQMQAISELSEEKKDDNTGSDSQA